MSKRLFVLSSLVVQLALPAFADDLPDPLAAPSPAPSAPAQAALPSPPVPSTPAAPVEAKRQEPADIPPPALRAPTTSVRSQQATKPAQSIPTEFRRLTAVTSGTLSQLDELRTQSALAAERVKLMELQNRLSGQVPAGQTIGVGGGLAPNSSQPVADVPYVAAVQGYDGDLSAVIFLPKQGFVTVRVGTELTGLGSVQSIGRDGVRFATKTGSRLLGISRSEGGK